MAFYSREVAYSKHNPCYILGRPDINYLGCTRNPPGSACTFQSTVFGLRAMFSLLRFWHRCKSAQTVRDYLSHVYWLEEHQRFSVSSVICSVTGFEPSTPIDYHTEDARRFVAAFCKVMTGMDNLDEQIILAQNMIL